MTITITAFERSPDGAMGRRAIRGFVGFDAQPAVNAKPPAG